VKYREKHIRDGFFEEDPYDFRLNAIEHSVIVQMEITARETGEEFLVGTLGYCTPEATLTEKIDLFAILQARMIWMEGELEKA